MRPIESGTALTLCRADFSRPWRTEVRPTTAPINAMKWKKKRPLRITAYLLLAALFGAFHLWEGVILLTLIALVIEFAFFP